MSPSRKQRFMRDHVVPRNHEIALGATPGAFAATTVTYNAGGTSPGMNVVDDPGNAVHLVVTGGTQNNHVGLRSSNTLPLTAGSGCLQVSATEVTCFASGPRYRHRRPGDGDDVSGTASAWSTGRSSVGATATTLSTAPIRPTRSTAVPATTRSRAPAATTCSMADLATTSS